MELATVGHAGTKNGSRTQAFKEVDFSFLSAQIIHSFIFLPESEELRKWIISKVEVKAFTFTAMPFFAVSVCLHSQVKKNLKIRVQMKFESFRTGEFGDVLKLNLDVKA